MVLSSHGAAKGACTGTVIGRDLVLTAAHCVAGKKLLAVAYPENGTHVLQRVVARATHPEYSRKARVSIDLAVLRVENALPRRLVALPLDRGGSEGGVGASVRLAGFGISVDSDANSAGRLRSAQAVVLPRHFPRFLRLGSGDAPRLSDLAICTGDSGGPVLDAGGTRVIGVVYGREKLGGARHCGATAQAVRVAPQAAWIDGVIRKWTRPARTGSLR
jgi:secreted trypsin-like serine protease